jgi:hypothetical protein
MQRTLPAFQISLCSSKITVSCVLAKNNRVVFNAAGAGIYPSPRSLSTSFSSFREFLPNSPEICKHDNEHHRSRIDNARSIISNSWLLQDPSFRTPRPQKVRFLCGPCMFVKHFDETTRLSLPTRNHKFSVPARCYLSGVCHLESPLWLPNLTFSS